MTEMKYRRRRYYKYAVYTNYELARQRARYWRKKEGVRYQLIKKGKWTELWLSKQIC